MHLASLSRVSILGAIAFPRWRIQVGACFYWRCLLVRKLLVQVVIVSSWWQLIPKQSGRERIKVTFWFTCSCRNHSSDGWLVSFFPLPRSFFHSKKIINSSIKIIFVLKYFLNNNTTHSKKQNWSYFRMLYLCDIGLSIIHCPQNLVNESELWVLTSSTSVTF